MDPNQQQTPQPAQSTGKRGIDKRFFGIIFIVILGVASVAGNNQIWNILLIGTSLIILIPYFLLVKPEKRSKVIIRFILVILFFIIGIGFVIPAIVSRLDESLQNILTSFLFLLFSLAGIFMGFYMGSKRFYDQFNSWFNNLPFRKKSVLDSGVSPDAARDLDRHYGFYGNKLFGFIFLVSGVFMFVIAIGSFFRDTSDSQLSNQSQQKVQQLGPTTSPAELKIYEWVEITASESATWNNYIDKDKGFSIQYPETWRQAYDGSTPYFTPDPPCEGACGGIVRGVYLHFEKNIKNASSMDYIKNEVLLDNNGRPEPGFIIKNQPTFLSNLDATMVDGLQGAGCPGPMAYIIGKNNIIISLYTDFCQEDESISDKVISKILSTFKFTNE